MRVVIQKRDDCFIARRFAAEETFRFERAQIQTIKDWIDAGAKNN